MSTKVKLEKLADILREWQHIETASVVQTAQVIDRTRSPVIRLVMEIIQSDSAMHHRIQQLLLDVLEREAVTLRVEDVEEVWGAIEAHVEAERRTGALISEARKALSGSTEVVLHYLLSYLAVDEAKHDRLLEGLALVKRGMYPT